MDDKFWYFHFLILKYISSNSTCRTIFIITIGIICFGKVDSDRKKGYSVLMITKGNPQMYFNIPNWRFATIGKGSSVMCKAMNKIIIKKSISKITKKDIIILLIFYQSILLNKLIIICYSMSSHVPCSTSILWLSISSENNSMYWPLGSIYFRGFAAQ